MGPRRRASAHDRVVLRAPRARGHACRDTRPDQGVRLVMSAPLVTIAIPTYNRAHELRRAIGSARGQTHRHLEILVCDNASADETEAIVGELQAEDQRLRYVRRPRNVGPVENFNAALADARGDYVALLADDDWIDADYVERCLAVLRADSRVAIAAGRSRYLRD